MQTSNNKSKLLSHNKTLNEHISSESEEELSESERNDKRRRDSSSESEIESRETAQQKKIRLAKKYLEEIEREERERDNTEDVSKAEISGRLRAEVHKQVAHNYQSVSLTDIRCLKNGHKLSITCVVVTTDNKSVFSAGKDCCIIKWDFMTGKRLTTINGVKKNANGESIGHSKPVLSLAISSDNKFLASGCFNKIINIWNPESCELIHTFKGHRDAVSGLAFRKDSHQLFSASFDRSVKVWNLEEMVYVETLFGHQDSIMAIDSYIRERAITAGGRDSSARIWKIVEDSQLVFHGNNASVDCVKFIDEQHFVSASDDGYDCGISDD